MDPQPGMPSVPTQRDIARYSGWADRTGQPRYGAVAPVVAPMAAPKAKVKAKAPREKRDRFDLQHRARESRNSRVRRGALSKLRYKVV